MKFSRGELATFAGTLAVAALLSAPPAFSQSAIDIIKGRPGEAVRSDDIPAGRSGWAFGSGVGADTDPMTPPSFAVVGRTDARFRAGFGYSCGQFDPFDNVEQMLNSAIDKFRQLPQQFVMAAQAAVAGLPAYILNKINPSLYNVVTKNLDEAFRLFEVNFKDCQQIEREIALGRNPYHGLVMAGIGDRMRLEMNFGGGTIDERMRTVREHGPENGVVMADGRRYGGAGQPPIEVSRNVLLAGVNLLTERAVDDESAFASNIVFADRYPVTSVFDSPEDLIAFATEIYGSQAFELDRDGVTRSTPGTGYQRQYINLRDEAIAWLMDYVWRRVDRREFEEETGWLLPPALIDELRRLPHYEQSIAIDDQARRRAIEQLRVRFDYLLQALKTGLKEPNLAQSEAYEVFEREIGKLVIAVHDDIAHLNAATFLD